MPRGGISAAGKEGLSTQAYRKIIGRVFHANYRSGAREVEFGREEMVEAAKELGIERVKNLGDLVYSFRFRQAFPDEIVRRAPKGMEWVLRLIGGSRYRFSLVPVGMANILPRESMAEIKIPDATPGLIAKYALTAEQSLLAKLRYNRMIDIFAGVTCYSLQNHLQTQVKSFGQVETDELYLGIDRNGVHYALPVEAKAGRDFLSVVQMEQDIALCREKFPDLICRPVAAQFMAADLIALFDFQEDRRGLAIRSEKHYRLVPPDQIGKADLDAYRRAIDQTLS